LLTGFGVVMAPTFGEELRVLRVARGMSLSSLARKVHCNKGYLSRIEHGHRRPSATVVRLCDEVLNAAGTLIEAGSRLPQSRLVTTIAMPARYGNNSVFRRVLGPTLAVAR
jgi:transcriptional regulator with XRE-family HTH domain